MLALLSSLETLSEGKVESGERIVSPGTHLLLPVNVGGHVGEGKRY